LSETSKLLIFPGILLALILLSGCTQNQAELKAPELQDCKGESECLYENSQLEQSIGICNNIIDSERKSLCYSMLEGSFECGN